MFWGHGGRQETGKGVGTSDHPIVVSASVIGRKRRTSVGTRASSRKWGTSQRQSPTLGSDVNIPLAAIGGRGSRARDATAGASAAT